MGSPRQSVSYSRSFGSSITGVNAEWSYRVRAGGRRGPIAVADKAHRDGLLATGISRIEGGGCYGRKFCGFIVAQHSSASKRLLLFPILCPYLDLCRRARLCGR